MVRDQPTHQNQTRVERGHLIQIFTHSKGWQPPVLDLHIEELIGGGVMFCPTRKTRGVPDGAGHGAYEVDLWARKLVLSVEVWFRSTEGFGGRFIEIAEASRRREDHREMLHEEAANEYRRKAGWLIQALCRVVAEFLRKVGRKPSNLMLLNKRLTNGFWARTNGEFLEDIVPILKGYFVWASHVVVPTSRELELMKGHPVVRSESDKNDTWLPPQLLDGGPSWTEEPHVVTLGAETFIVSYSIHYAEPCCNEMCVLL